MKGCSLLDLSGMSEESMINNVMIWRPLLKHDKAKFFSFSHRFGVPYFKDSTPSWSSRGRMRNELLPLIGSIFGDGFNRNLSLLSDESIQFAQMAKKKIFDPFWRRINKSECSAFIDCSGYEFESLFFWKESLTNICERILGLPRIHEKGIKRELLPKLRQKNKKKQSVGCWLQLRREYKCYLTNNHILIVFVPEFAPIAPGKVIKYKEY